MSKEIEPQAIKSKRPALTPQQTLAAALIAAGRTDTEISTEVGVAASTVKTWRSRPQVQAEVNRILDRLTRDIVRRGYAAVPQAVEYLISTLTDPTASHTNRIGAAKILLDRFPDWTPERAAEPEPDAPRQLLPPAIRLDPPLCQPGLRHPLPENH